MSANNKGRTYPKSWIIKLVFYTLFGFVAWRYKSLFNKTSIKPDKRSLSFIGWV